LEEIRMKLVLGAAMFAAIAVATPALADDVPCENMLKDLRAALQNAKPSDADAAKIKELEDKGIERCNADDDARADEFFAQAMKILGK
jgi:hypothetical protein